MVYKNLRTVLCTTMNFELQSRQFQTYWSIIINIILKQYFLDRTTCLIWPHDDNFNLIINTDNILINIYPDTLEQAFEQDVFNHTSIEIEQNTNGIFYDKWIKKLLASIQNSHCEGFVVFQQDILPFMKAFEKASVYSIWRSLWNRFLFVYYGTNNTEEYFQSSLMQKQSEILIVYADYMNSHIFQLKSNKFVGSLLKQPQELYILATFNAINQSSDIISTSLYNRKKIKNLQGREIVVGIPDYPPFVVINEHDFPQYYDQSENNPSHRYHVEGVEMRVIFAFCRLYNCTVQVDTTEKYDWGTTSVNYTGSGVIGLVSKKKINVAIGVMYYWYNDYRALDMSAFIGRSGLTCLVPVAPRLTNWFLPFKPFQHTLWLAVIISLLVESISLFLAHYYQHRQYNNSNVYGRQQSSNYSWLYSCQFGYITALKLFVSQTTHYVVKSFAIRILLCACYVNDIIVTSIYGGVLSSILTLPGLALAPDNLQRLYEFDLKWAGNSLAWIKSIMESNNTIYKRLVKNFHIENTTEMIKSVNARKYMGFGIEKTMFHHFGETEFVTIDVLSYWKLMLEDIYFEYTTIIVERLWPFLSDLNDLILRLHSSGFFKHWEWEVTAKYLNITIQNQIRDSKYNNARIGPSPLDMNNFAGIIIWWLLGIILSILIFLGELLWYKWSLKQ